MFLDNLLYIDLCRHIVLEDKEEDQYTDKPYVTFEQEFNNLPRGQQYSWTEAAKHPTLNRVSHLVAYDHNRVVVKQSFLGKSSLW